MTPADRKRIAEILAPFNLPAHEIQVIMSVREAEQVAETRRARDAEAERERLRFLAYQKSGEKKLAPNAWYRKHGPALAGWVAAGGPGSFQEWHRARTTVPKGEDYSAERLERETVEMERSRVANRKAPAAPKRATRKRTVSDELEFTRDDKGVPHKSQQNIVVALHKLCVRVRYDSFAHEEIIDGLPGFGPKLDDHALNRLWLTVDSQFQFRPQKEFFCAVVGNEAQANRFHPVRDYLDGLKWDKRKRIDTWLALYAGAPDTEYVRAVGRLVLIAAVRRVRQPGCKFDEMLVLESEQGKDKSSGLRVLAVDDDWFTDDLPLGADTKRTMETMAGKWIVEAGELKGMSKGDVAALKAFLSRQTDEARMAYGRKKTVMPRQCVLIGTTNETSGYLKDGTGNRRFWPVRVKGFDAKGLREVRDQLWAEACEAEAAGESIRLDPKLYASAAIEQSGREADDPVLAVLTRYLDGVTGKLWIPDCYEILNIEPAKANQEQKNAIGSAMRRLGWERKQRRHDGDVQWHYVKGDASQGERTVSVTVQRSASGERLVVVR
jgi:hypothetical protein